MGTVLARNGLHVVLLTRRDNVAEFIRKEHRNPTHLKEFPLPFNLTATTDAERALRDVDYIVHSIPVQSSLEYLTSLAPLIPEHVPIISTSKGLHTKTLQLMSDMIPVALSGAKPDLESIAASVIARAAEARAANAANAAANAAANTATGGAGSTGGTSGFGSSTPAVSPSSSAGSSSPSSRRAAPTPAAAAAARSQPTAFLSGPSFAKELMEGWPTGLVCAAEDEKLAREVAGIFASRSVRVWTSTDVVGVEGALAWPRCPSSPLLSLHPPSSFPRFFAKPLSASLSSPCLPPPWSRRSHAVGGALKNIYAIAAGALEGLGLGYNTTSMLVTRAVAEMQRLATAMGSTQPTLVGLSGIGDLMLTCYGALSRNRTVGVRLGRGETLAEILATTSEAAEGVATTPAALALARHYGIDVPLIESVNGILSGNMSAVDALLGLMGGGQTTVDTEKIL